MKKKKMEQYILNKTNYHVDKNKDAFKNYIENIYTY